MPFGVRCTVCGATIESAHAEPVPEGRELGGSSTMDEADILRFAGSPVER